MEYLPYFVCIRTGTSHERHHKNRNRAVLNIQRRSMDIDNNQWIQNCGSILSSPYYHIHETNRKTRRENEMTWNGSRRLNQYFQTYSKIFKIQQCILPEIYKCEVICMQDIECVYLSSNIPQKPKEINKKGKKKTEKNRNPACITS